MEKNMEKENLETDSSHDDIISVQKGKRDREDINGESENSANKKQSVGSSIPNDVKVSSDSVVAAVEEEDKGSSNCCALCMEGADEKKNIIPHNCSQCKKDAWVICDLCNESRLSRACPMCNGDYAPLLLYSMPGDGEFLEIIKNKPLEQQAQCMKAMQFAKIRLISVSNVMVYNPVERMLSFSLPVDATLPPKQVRYMLVSLPLTVEDTSSPAAVSSEPGVGDEVNPTAASAATKTASNNALITSILASLRDEGVFRFSNRVWDLLETRVETENDSNADTSSNSESSSSSSYTGDIRSAMSFVMGALSRKAFSVSGLAPGNGDGPGGMCSVLYSCMTPEELQEQVDPPQQEETSVGGSSSSAGIDIGGDASA